MVTSTQSPTDHELARHSFSMENRYAVPSVNTVFKDNILLTIDYMSGKVTNTKDISWPEVEKPFHYAFTLNPNQTFSFHDAVLPQYQGAITKTTNSHFSGSEGFENDGYLYGDGVCHLASLMNWIARDGGLDVVSPTAHDFAQIPEVPKAYGVAIYDDPGSIEASEQQNLYITNNQNHPVTFYFDYENNKLDIQLTESY